MPERIGVPVACLALSLLAVPAAAAITGVCPDGSIFVVQTSDAIPCSHAKRVDPIDMPPIQPKLLPRPYGWERFNRRSDPNNPYNLVEEGRGYAPPALEPSDAPQAPPHATPPGIAPPHTTPPGVTAPPPPAPAPPRMAVVAPTPRGLDLSLSERDVADLDEIVILLQSVAPATLARYADDGERRAVLQLAHSRSFEQRLHGELARAGGGGRGPVLLFRAEARAEEPFHGNLTFVQGHVAFHPDPANPDQFGVIDGALGPQGEGDRVLGYAVLPEHLDAGRPVDVYWDDRRITATLKPE
jgi:hypothetical protein